MPEHRRVAHGIQTATPSHLSRIPKDSILKTRIPYPMIQRRKTMRQVASEQEAPVYLGHGCLPAQSKNRRGCRRTLDFLCIFCSLCFLRSYLHPRSKGKGERKDSSFPLYYTTWRRLCRNGLSVFSLTFPLPLQGFHERDRDFYLNHWDSTTESRKSCMPHIGQGHVT